MLVTNKNTHLWPNGSISNEYIVFGCFKNPFALEYIHVWDEMICTQFKTDFLYQSAFFPVFSAIFPFFFKYHMKKRLYWILGCKILYQIRNSPDSTNFSTFHNAYEPNAYQSWIIRQYDMIEYIYPVELHQIFAYIWNMLIEWVLGAHLVDFQRATSGMEMIRPFNISNWVFNEISKSIGDSQ